MSEEGSFSLFLFGIKALLGLLNVPAVYFMISEVNLFAILQ